MTSPPDVAGLPAMAGPVVHFWLIGTDQPDDVLAGLAGTLDAAERERAARCPVPEHRRRFIAAHGAARAIMSGYLGIGPAQVRWRHGPHGKPEVAGAEREWGMSLSRAGRYAALAVAAGRRVGVDLEQVPPDDGLVRLAQRFYPAAEAGFVTAGESGRRERFAQLWVRKEACVKAAGGRLMEGMRLDVRGPGPVVVHDPGSALPGPYLVRDVSAPDGFRAAVAATGTGPFEVTHHAWPG